MYFRICRKNGVGMSKGSYLGEFEQIVLLALARLEEVAYGMAIMEEI